MKKKILILGVVLIILMVGTGLVAIQNRVLCKNCNILLISLDTLSAKHLPCYGYDKNTAPNLCQFAKDNIYFSNSYSPSHWTRPSQTSVLTGVQPSTHEVLSPYIDKLAPKYKTIQEILKKNGYTTYYYGPKIDGASWDDSMTRGFDHMGDYIWQSTKHWNEALDVLAQNQKNKQPTFMFLHTYYMHAPYSVGKEDLKFVSKEDEKKYPEIPLTQKDYKTLTPEMAKFVLDSLQQRVKESYTPESLKLNNKMLADFKKAKSFNEQKKVFSGFADYEVESFARDWYFKKIKDLSASDYVKSMYDERIYQMDSEIKGFLDKLKNKFNKDTIVVIYADHGETLGERGIYEHCLGDPKCLYMETVKVPLIIRVPGMKSEKIDKLAQGIDIYPTILKLVGIKTPDYIEGEDLFNIKKKFVVTEEGKTAAMLIDKNWSLFSGDLVNYSPNNLELYDLINDKNQLLNVADKYPKITTEKVNQLKAYEQKQKENRDAEK